MHLLVSGWPGSTIDYCVSLFGNLVSNLCCIDLTMNVFTFFFTIV
jgi:hypothetical protein